MLRVSGLRAGTASTRAEYRGDVIRHAPAPLLMPGAGLPQATRRTRHRHSHSAPSCPHTRGTIVESIERVLSERFVPAYAGNHRQAREQLTERRHSRASGKPCNPPREQLHQYRHSRASGKPCNPPREQLHQYRHSRASGNQSNPFIRPAAATPLASPVRAGISNNEQQWHPTPAQEARSCMAREPLPGPDARWSS